jgi:CO/xanthine dehydrogenase Mo-binding subunit
VGIVAAIANAVYDAPGKCGRDLPIIDKLILPNGQRVE